MTRWGVLAVVVVLAMVGIGAAEVPATPACITNTTGNFWVNHTWVDVGLISGEDVGVFYGFNWTGSAWQGDSVIVSGLGEVGDYSTPTNFQKDGVWYLISGEIGREIVCYQVTQKDIL